MTFPIAFLPSGPDIDKEILIAEYDCILDDSNSAFRLHAFLAPNGTLQNN